MSQDAEIGRRGRAARRTLRWHLAVLVLLVVVGGARGLYWVAVSNLWQTDEGQHYGYVRSLATGDGIPVVGEDRIPAEVLALSKLGPVDGIASRDVAASPLDTRWGAAREQYEGGQGPPYYALLAPAFRLAEDLGPLERLYVLRALTMALTLATVPLTYLLARALLPAREAVWPLAPAVVVTWQSFNASGATVNNDALVLPLATATLLGVALALRHGPGPLRGLLTGLAAGTAVVTKASAVVIAGPALLLAVAAVVRHRRRPGALAVWALSGVAGAAAPVLPWLRWQQEVYGSPAGAVERFNAVLAATLGPPRPLTPATVRGHWDFAAAGLFGQEFLGPVGYHTLVLGLVAGVAAAGVVAALARRRGGDALVLVLLAASLPLAFATMVAVVHLVLGGVGSVAGRYLHAALPLVAVLVAGGAVTALGRRGGTVAVTVLVAVTLQAEVALADRYVEGLYQRGLPVPGAAPAVAQEQADRYGPLPPVVVEPPCAATLVALAFPEEPPRALAVAAGEQPGRPAARVAEEDLGGLTWGYYDTGGLAETFTVTAAGSPYASVSDADREPSLAFDGEQGDPVARVYCAVPDADDVRFAQLFVQHPPLSHDVVTGWPRGWSTASWLVAALVAAVTTAAAILAASPSPARTGAPGARPGRAGAAPAHPPAPLAPAGGRAPRPP
jgi:4-amino-4-deoxy-L-arabinose transferase-like glycosyltransferase